MPSSCATCKIAFQRSVGPTVARPFHERNFAMAEFIEMLQGKLRRAAMIEKNIGDALYRMVARDGDGGQRHGFTEQSVHGNQPLDSALHKNMRVAVQQFLIVVMSDRQKEKTVLPEVTLDAADDHRCVGVAEIARDYSDGVSALHAQRARQIIWTIIQLARCGENARLGAFRYGTSSCGVV